MSNQRIPDNHDLKPLTELIDEWVEQGLIPHQINEKVDDYYRRRGWGCSVVEMRIKGLDDGEWQKRTLDISEGDPFAAEVRRFVEELYEDDFLIEGSGAQTVEVKEVSGKVSAWKVDILWEPKFLPARRVEE